MTILSETCPVLFSLKNNANKENGRWITIINYEFNFMNST